MNARSLIRINGDKTAFNKCANIHIIIDRHILNFAIECTCSEIRVDKTLTNILIFFQNINLFYIHRCSCFSIKYFLISDMKFSLIFDIINYTRRYSLCLITIYNIYEIQVETLLHLSYLKSFRLHFFFVGLCDYHFYRLFNDLFFYCS